jgi:hypothetical protein
MFKRLFTGYSLGRVSHQQLRNKVLALGADLFEFLVFKVERRLFYSLENFGLIWMLERQIARYHHVEQNSEGPDVRFFVVVALKDLRCHVVGSADFLLKLLIVAFYLGQSKVDELDLVVFYEHDIFWFDVSVNYAVCMTVVDSFKELLHILGSLLLTKDLVFLVNYFLEQWDSINEFHYYAKI